MKLKYLIPAVVVIILIIWYISSYDNTNGSGHITGTEQVEFSPAKDRSIQEYNLGVRKEQTGKRYACDTLALVEYILNNYPEGSYLVNVDKTLTYNIPKPAVLYYQGSYVFGVVARSKEGERLIEVKNVVGYDQSFIDLDSTKLGTAFFYLTLFQCQDGSFNTIWEVPIPSHGGFNKLSLERWFFKGTPYIKVNFHYAQGIGHIDYNYFLVDGLTSPPHLLMTYKGINFKRTPANINSDKYPDYFEHVYYDFGDTLYSRDSVGFVWVPKDSVYVNVHNRRQTRPY